MLWRKATSTMCAAAIAADEISQVPYSHCYSSEIRTATACVNILHLMTLKTQHQLVSDLTLVTPLEEYCSVAAWLCFSSTDRARGEIRAMLRSSPGHLLKAPCIRRLTTGRTIAFDSAAPLVDPKRGVACEFRHLVNDTHKLVPQKFGLFKPRLPKSLESVMSCPRPGGAV